MRNVQHNITISVNNLDVSYSDNKLDGVPVIIFVHGFPLNKSMWNKQMSEFKDDFRVIAYDIRGHGNTEGGNAIFSIDLFARDLICFMDELKIDKAILCGFSMGGYISLNTIENFPERFSALILSDTSCVADTPEAREKRLRTIDTIKANGMEKYADESIKNLFAPESIEKKIAEIESVMEMILKTSKQSIYNTLNALSSRKETCSKLMLINVPTLILVGKEDKITPLEAALWMHERIKESSMKIIGHAGHLSNLENPLEFNDQLRKFLVTIFRKDLVLTPEKSLVFDNNEKVLNSKILKITMTIQDHYPELSKYLDEMPVTIPTEKNPKMTLKNLSQYYESLNSMLNKYLLEHPHSAKV
jgi:pimeloyl-ACP methyl ester carboxylesterase